jgi:hypothetical protein
MNGKNKVRSHDLHCIIFPRSTSTRQRRVHLGKENQAKLVAAYQAGCDLYDLSRGHQQFGEDGCIALLLEHVFRPL